MSRKPIEKIRNIGIIAHIDAGKTTVSERFLYYSGRTHRMGEVHDGQAAMDFREDERERGITISSAATTFLWGDCQINLIDTPGHVDFTAEVERSLRVLDGAVVVFDGVKGVEPQSETVWHQADHYRVPRLCFVNKMDRIGADFPAAVASIREKLGAVPAVLQLPAGSSEEFSGVIDLLGGTLLRWDAALLGETWVPEPLPPEWKAPAAEGRARLVETLAEAVDAIAERWLEGRDIPLEDLHEAVRQATLTGAVVPVLCGAALRNTGIQPLLDAVCRYLPSPLDVPPAIGHDPKTSVELARRPDPAEPFSALVYKVTTSTAADLYSLRVYSGRLETGGWAYNPRTGEKERLRRLLQLHAQHGQPVDDAIAGDIVAATSLKNTVTGDTLCDPAHPIAFEPIHFPDTVVSVAVEARTAQERDRLLEALRRVGREDPTLRQKFDEETGQILLSGMGELHMDIVRNRLARDFHVEAAFGKPRVSYRETVTAPVQAEAEFARMLGQQQHYASVTVRLGPWAGQGGAKVRTVSSLSEGTLPAPLIAGLLDTLRTAAEGGGLYGYPVVDVEITLIGAKVGDQGQPEIALNSAATLAFREALRRTQVSVLEPIMKLEIRTPEEHLGAVVKNLGSRRALVEETCFLPNAVLVRGTVPLSEMFGYSTALRSLSQGRASFHLEPLDYRPIPPSLLSALVQKL